MGLVSLLLGLLAGCNDSVGGGIDKLPDYEEDIDPIVDGGTSDAASEESDAAAESDGADAAVETDASEEDPADLTNVPTFAVHLADYGGGATGVAILDGEANVLSERYVSTASTLPGLSAAIAPDMALPSRPCDPKLLTIIGRGDDAYVLQIDLKKSEVVRQVSTQLGTGEVAYSSNPQDIVCLEHDKALVSRLNPHPKPADPLDLGDDLIVLNLEDGSIERRIDLSDFVPQSDHPEGPTFARPANLVRVGNQVVIGLGMFNASYSYYELPGKVLVLSLDTFELTEVPFQNLGNCGTITPVADRDDAVLVACAGNWSPEYAGVAMVRVDEDGTGTVLAEFQSVQGERTLSGGSLGGATSLGGSRAIVTAQSSDPDVTDAAYVVDLEAGEATLLFESATSWSLGAGAIRLETGILLIPDENVGIHVFEMAGNEITELDPIVFGENEIPARRVVPLRAL